MALLSNTGIRAGASAGGDEPWGTDNDGRSIRFEPGDTAYLNRTFSAGNQQKWTFSCWVKRAALGSSNYTLFSADNSNTDFLTIRYEADQLRVDAQGDGQGRVQVTTTPVYRDPAAWYHVVIALDTTQGTAADRCKIYINGVQQDTSNTFTQNKSFAVNDTNSHEIGRRSDGNDNYFSGLLSEIHFIDGSQLAASSFGSQDSLGIWNPTADLSGLDYGTTGFYLKFDNSGEIGHDRCGKNNDWTTNNITATDGSNPKNIDFVFDHPISDGTDNRNGGEVRGNYCTWNPLEFGSSGIGGYKQGNLKHEGASDWKSTTGTFPIKSGKWYYEATIVGNTYGTATGNLAMAIGYCQVNEPLTDEDLYNNSTQRARTVCMWNTGGYNNFGAYQGTVCSPSDGDVIGVALDMDGNNIKFYLNNTEELSVTLGDTDSTLVPWTIAYYTAAFEVNFGQRAFKYTAPSGYKCLCTHNLPDLFDGTAAENNPNKYFDTRLYTGNGSSTAVTLPFKPDFLWLKKQSDSGNHTCWPRTEHPGRIHSDHTDGSSDGSSALASFDSSGYTLGTHSDTNQSSKTYVQWAWGGGTDNSSTNTDGENITVGVGNQCVNSAAGFSFTIYDGDGSGTADSDSGDSVGHGLSQVPEFVWIKRWTSGNNSINWFEEFGDAKMIHMNTNGAISGTNYCIPTAPTATKVDLGNNPEVNKTGDDYVLWCWHSVYQFSHIDKYVGNGSADGTFVNCGFRPAYLLIKKYSEAEGWIVMNSASSPTNPIGTRLVPDTDGAEDTNAAHPFDFVSNGFKIRNTDSWTNDSGESYLFMAFAKHPFKLARAR